MRPWSWKFCMQWRDGDELILEVAAAPGTRIWSMVWGRSEQPCPLHVCVHVLQYVQHVHTWHNVFMQCI